MKVVKIIFGYIFTIIFALSILALILINIISSKILDENYVLEKLDKENYYEEVYQEAKSNFENYIYQSGLDENVLNDIVSKEKIEKDTKTILNNIYGGLVEEIDTTEISTKLNENITASVNRTLSSSEQKAVEDFVAKICNEYKTTISNTKYESKINSIYKKVNMILDLTNKALLVMAGASLLMITLLTIRKIYKILARLGVACVIDGSILIGAKIYVYNKVYINGITILSNSVSKVLRVILNDIFGVVMKNGLIFLGLGIVMIVLYGLIKSIRKQKREEEKYSPEG